MLTELEISLQKALSEYGLRELPEEWSPESGVEVIDGIALVTKIGGIQDYCKVVNEGLGRFAIKRDYGKCARIISIDKIFPVNVLQKRFAPVLKSDKDIVMFLSKNGHNAAAIESLLNTDGKTAEQIQADKAVVESYVNAVAVEIAQKTIKEEKRCKEITEYSKRIKVKKDEEKVARKTRRTKKSDSQQL